MFGRVEKFSTTPSMRGEQIFCAQGSARGANICSSIAVRAEHLRACSPSNQQKWRNGTEAVFPRV
uniref:Uncharacterized protein n=1 Tax=Romanomermis culicivorax TaxID=13658 RepID=A0A915HWQ7_ROMCU